MERRFDTYEEMIETFLKIEDESLEAIFNQSPFFWDEKDVVLYDENSFPVVCE